MRAPDENPLDWPAMNERSASRTASMVAAYRARATERPDALISDPWARALAGEEGEAIAEAVDRMMPDRELWVAVRTAWLDEQIQRFVAGPDGHAQVVVLGAGFDTRAARLATPGVRFFEVDHPASQREKLTRLGRLSGYPVEAATYVECDFEHHDFLERLLARGFDVARPAVITWEGVTMYLAETAVRHTLSRIAFGCEPHTVLLFDHLMKKIVDASRQHETEQAARRLVQDLGERFVFGVNDPLPMLYEEGFRWVQSASFDELCLNLTGSYERSREFRFQRVVAASRRPPSR